jgi:hypothetical protein
MENFIMTEAGWITLITLSITALLACGALITKTKDNAEGVRKITEVEIPRIDARGTGLDARVKVIEDRCPTRRITCEDHFKAIDERFREFDKVLVDKFAALVDKSISDAIFEVAGKKK